MALGRPLPQQPSCPANRLVCQLCWGQGEAKVGLRLPAPGAHEQSPPLQGTGIVPRAESGGRGRGGGQQLLQTLSRKPSEHTWKHQMTDLGFRGLQLALMARTCCGRQAGWGAPVFLFSDKVGKACVAALLPGCWALVAHGGPGRQGPFTARPAAKQQGGTPEENISTRRQQQGGAWCSSPGASQPRRGPPWPLCPGVRRLLSPGVVGAG